MEPPAGLTSILAVIFFCSLVSAGALAAAWSSFDRPRHAMTWALAFAAAALEAAITAARAHGIASAALVAADVLATLASVVLVLAGALQRATPRKRQRVRAATMILAPFLVLCAVMMAPRAMPVAIALLGFYMAAVLLLAARAVRPRGRIALPPERLAVAVLALFAAFEAGLAGALLASAMLPGGRAVLAEARKIYLIGYPTLSVAAGIVAVLLLASDLAGRLRTLAAFDPLTGIANRRGFEEAALRAIATARRAGRPLSLAIGDVDHFKAINDRHGHAAGDAALRHIAETLGTGLRGADLIGRVGGEEFAVLLVDTPARHAAEAVDRLRLRVASRPPDALSGALTMSFGVAELPDIDADGEETLDALVARADRALYAAKAGGRDRVALAD